jgi:hypothetical protein
MVSTELRALREFVMSRGMTASALEDFDIQRVMDGGQSLDERNMRRDERAARMEELQEELDSQFEKLQNTKSALKQPDGKAATDDAKAQENAESINSRKQHLLSQTASPPKPETKESLALHDIHFTPHAHAHSKSPAPHSHTRMSRQASSNLFSRQVSTAASVASNENTDETDSKEGRPVRTTVTRLQSMGRQSSVVASDGTGPRKKTMRASGIGRMESNGNYDSDELQPLGANATSVEVELRINLLALLCESMGLGAARRGVNATAEYIHIISNILATSQTALWDSLMLNRKALDFYIKIKTFIDGTVSCNIAGTEEQDVNRVLEDMLSITAMQLGSQFSNEWNTECNIAPQLFAALNIALASAAAESESAVVIVPPKNRPLPEYFRVKDNERELFDRVEIIKNSVQRMIRYSDAGYENVTDHMSEHLRDWSDSKLCALGFEDALKKEGDRIRALFNRELDVVKVEMMKLRQRVGSLLDDNAALNKTIEDMTADQEALKALPDAIIALNATVTAEKNKYNELHEEMHKLQVKQGKFDEMLHAKQDLIDQVNSQLKLMTMKAQVLEKGLEEEARAHTHTKATLSDTELELGIVHRREQARWAAGIHECVQTEVDTADGSSQTEFSVPSVSFDFRLLQLVLVLNHSLLTASCKDHTSSRGGISSKVSCNHNGLVPSICGGC